MFGNALGLPLLVALLTANGAVASDEPMVTVKNGSYIGIHSTEYNQDFFLGIPFAQPPVGDLRFRNPAPLNTTWNEPQFAVEYPPSCPGYGADPVVFNEDCLYLSVIRPSRDNQNELLPVAVFIHGGGFVGGQGTSQRYNMSFTIEHSVEMGQPILGVTLNYRLSGWGFMQSSEVTVAGEANWGLRDQRLALHWLQENLAAFGGDPNRVTIFGESAGATSVGLHLMAYNGRDDNLFARAIMQSGGPVVASKPLSGYQPSYDRLVTLAGCESSNDTLDCLRHVPYDQLNSIFNSSALSFGGTFNGPAIDGDIFSGFSSKALEEGNFVHVPIIIGTNSEEGTLFATPGINTTEQWATNLRSSGMNESIIAEILEAYPMGMEDSVFDNREPDWIPPATAKFGTQFRRVATYAGDQTFIASRRLVCETFSNAGLHTYSYRFNAVPTSNSGPDYGSEHYAEIGYMFWNLPGVGYPPAKVRPFDGLGSDHADLAKLMNGDWIAFVNSGNPNAWSERRNMAPTLGTTIPGWPQYKKCGSARNFLYNANLTSSVEKDTYRAVGMDLINSLNGEVFQR